MILVLIADLFPTLDGFDALSPILLATVLDGQEGFGQSRKFSLVVDFEGDYRWGEMGISSDYGENNREKPTDVKQCHDYSRRCIEVNVPTCCKGIRFGSVL